MRVAVIGGGLAGLSCAHELKKRRVEVVVFESAASFGGRAAGAPFLLGPEVFCNTFKLIDEAGLAGDVLPVRQTVGQFYRGRVYHHHVASAAGLLHFKGLGLLDKALLPKMALYLARHGAAIDLHRPGKGVAFDDETVAEFTRREFSQNVLNYIAGPLISTLFFYGSEETSKLLYLVLAKYMHHTGMFTLKGSLVRLAEKLSRELTVRPDTAAGVSRINGDYVISGETFERVVVATSGDRVLRIDGLPELLSEADRRFFNRAVYQSVKSVHVRTERPVDGRCYGVSIPRVEKMDASTITFYDFIDPSRTPQGEGLLSIAAGGPDVTSEQLMADLKQIYAAADPTAIETVDWPSAMPKFPPGRFRELEAFRARRRPPGLYFCGDYLLGPFVEAAITTGLEAAESVLTPG